MMSLQSALIRFCRAPALVELLELSKSSSDIMELLTPRENQHSDLLGWCFNAREGHGQGDTLLKDFLLDVFHRATEVAPGDKLFGRGLTRDFVKAWTPARILTTSFATAFCIREYRFSDSTKGHEGARLDLVIVDPENRILVIIENKAGARFRPNQLADYIEATQRTLLTRPVFKDFHVAFVAMDKNIDADDPPSEDENFDSRWARLDYSWLKHGSKRAEMSVYRGNQGAALLMAYCRAQTGFETENEQAISRKARDLAIEHPEVVAYIGKIAKDLQDLTAWTPSHLRSDSDDGLLLKLYLQNKDAFDRMLELPPLWLLNGRIEEHFPQYAHHENLDWARVWTAYRLPHDRPIPTRDDAWPLFLHVKHLNIEGKGRPRFKISVRWYPRNVPEDDVERVCTALSTTFKKAAGTAFRENGVKLIEFDADGVDEAVQQCRKYIASTQSAFAEF
jgi:PD-(D/E)XK nuclease superfamily